MLCKWCGMESLTADQCSWCHRSFATSNADSVEASEPETTEEEPFATIAGEDSAQAETPVAPWTIAPPVPAPAQAVPPPARTQPGAAGGSAPILSVRRPGGKRSVRPVAPVSRSSSAPAPVPAPAARVSAPTSVPAGRAHTPAPATPVARASGESAAPGRHAPAPPVPIHRRAVPAPGAPAPRATPGSAPTAPGSAPGVLGVSRPAARAETAQAQTSPVELAAEANVPTLGTFTPQKSKYYADQVIDPVSGTHYDAASGKPIQASPPPSAVPSEEEKRALERRQKIRKEKAIAEEYEEAQASQKTLLLRYVVAFAVVLGVTGIAAFFLKANYLYTIPLIVGQFLGALLMPVMRVVPWADEDADDLWFLIGLMLISGFVMVCGPVIALIFYLVLGFIRQSVNPAVLGCFLVAACTRLVVEVAIGHFSLELFRPFVWNGLPPLLINWAGLATAVGWYAAAPFHKLDE